jgi:hypothetical protein
MTDEIVVTKQISDMTGQVILLLTAGLIAVAGYYSVRFFLSLGQRCIIYRTGKNPIAIPLPLTGDALNLLAKINEKSKAAKGISKEEAEQRVGDQIRTMLDERMKMQKSMLDALKIKALAARTDEDKAKVKAMMQESIAKLEAQDQILDQELKKTGLNKEDVFKKYRIKAPKEEFIDSVLKDSDLESMMKD